MTDDDLPPGAHPPTSRWASSQVTFGPVGRVVCTVLLLLPEVWLLGQSLAAVVALALWTFVVLPLALRQVWRPVRIRRR